MTDQTPDVEEVSELATLADVIYDAGHPSIDHTEARRLAEAVARHLAELGILKDRLLATQDTRDYLRFELEQARVERERTRALVAAAKRWRAQFEKPARLKPPRMAALIVAVDALDGDEQATAPPPRPDRPAGRRSLDEIYATGTPEATALAAESAALLARTGAASRVDPVLALQQMSARIRSGPPPAKTTSDQLARMSLAAHLAQTFPGRTPEPKLVALHITHGSAPGDLKADRIAQAISDPGSILPRQPDESVPRWSTRAVIAVLEAPAAGTAITARAPEVDVDVETGAALLALVRRSVVWLDDTNGTGEAETRLRILKVVEEVGEVAAAVIGAVGQNPRKGVTHTLDDVAGELIDVALTAMVAAHSLRHADIAAMVADGVAKVAGRLDAMGVPA